ncbi:MAG: hypothetical protein R3321_13325 [Nitrososphaeraceae archaeon]|nr:hypothetical protein [Nitrososphaeraceae archaeon]
MSQLNDSSDENQRIDKENMSRATEWVDLVSSIFDRLTGKEAVVTYEFDNLRISIPRASGPGGKELGSAEWTINGKLIITAEAIKK